MLFTLSENSYRFYLQYVKIAGFSTTYYLLQIVAIICTSVFLLYYKTVCNNNELSA